MKRLASLRCPLYRLTGFGLRMTPAHHGRVQAFLHHFTGGSFEHRFAAQDRRAIGLLVEVGSNPLGFVGP